VLLVGFHYKNHILGQRYTSNLSQRRLKMEINIYLQRPTSICPLK